MALMAKKKAITALTAPYLYILAFLILALAYTIHHHLSRSFTFQRHRRQLSKDQSCLPAARYPHKDPILGLDLALDTYTSLQRNTYLSAEQSLYQRVGNTYTSISIGRTTIYTIEPLNIQTLLSTNFADYVYDFPRSSRLRFRRLMGEGLMTTDGAAWRHSRRLLQPSIKRGKERTLMVLEKHFQKLLERVPTEAGSEVDLQPLFFSLTMETALDLFVGEARPPAFGDDSVSAFTVAFDRGLRTVMVDFGLGPLTAWSSHRPWQLRKDRKLLERFIDYYVQEALARTIAPVSSPNTEEKRIEWSGGGGLFLDDLMQQTRDPVELRAELMFVMVAARDTTAGLLSNLWFVLVQRPDIYAKLRQEVRDTFPAGERPDLARLERMPFLRCCIKESLRLHPPVPSNSKISIRDTILPLGGGPDGKSPLLVPGGTAVGYCVYAMYRRQDLWGADAEEFRPERWEDGRQRGWQFLPFNGDPRVCLGQKLAMTEVAYVTARLVQTIKSVESRDARPWREELNLTLCSGGGMRVGVNVTNCAEYLYKKAWVSSNLEDKDQSIVVAADIYIACPHMRVPRHFGEVFAFSTAMTDDAMRSFEAMEDCLTGEARLWKTEKWQYKAAHEINSPWAVVNTMQRLQVKCVEDEEA